MKRSTALTTAGALVLTVAAGVTTLAAIDRPPATEPDVIVQYVDQAGNPVPVPVAPTTIGNQPGQAAPDAGTDPNLASEVGPGLLEQHSTEEHAAEEYQEAEYQEDEYQEAEDEAYGGEPNDEAYREVEANDHA